VIPAEITIRFRCGDRYLAAEIVFADDGFLDESLPIPGSRFTGDLTPWVQ
jgi:hypothetical protein